MSTLRSAKCAAWMTLHLDYMGWSFGAWKEKKVHLVNAAVMVVVGLL